MKIQITPPPKPAFLHQLDDMRVEVSRREQEIMQMATKMKTLEEQHQDYQKHIAVLKESLCAKEEHYTMLQTDVSSAHHMANRKVQQELAHSQPRSHWNTSSGQQC